MDNNNDNVIVQEVVKEMRYLDIVCDEIKLKINKAMKELDDYPHTRGIINYDAMVYATELEENLRPERKRKEYIEKYYEYLPRILRENKDIAIRALLSHNIIIGGESLIPFAHDKDVARIAIMDDWENTRIFEDILDKELLLEAAKIGAWLGTEGGGALTIMRDKHPEVFQNDDYMRELLEYPGSTCFLEFASDNIKNDKDVIMNILTEHYKFIPEYIYKSIGDSLKGDPDVQKAFAEAMFEKYEVGSAPGAEVFEFIYWNNRYYDSLANIDKEFVKNVINIDGFVERVISLDPTKKEWIESNINSIKQHDDSVQKEVVQPEVAPQEEVQSETPQLDKTTAETTVSTVHEDELPETHTTFGGVLPQVVAQPEVSQVEEPQPEVAPQEEVQPVMPQLDNSVQNEVIQPNINVQSEMPPKLDSIFEENTPEAPVEHTISR